MLVVFSLTEEQGRAVVESMKLPYPLYMDPDWKVFEDYGTGHVLFGPKQAWVGIDGNGIIRYLWRSGENGKTGRVPMPLEALEQFERALR